MTDTIIGNIKELKSLENEIKRLSLEMRSLKLRKKIIEEQIIDYLEENNQPGIKYNNTIILAHERLKTVAKKKPERISNGMGVLERHGVRDAGKALEELMIAMKGNTSKVSYLKIKDNSK